MYKPIKKLSASSIKTFDSCSWIYYSKYFLKLPDPSNQGAIAGGIIHEILELLLNKNKYYSYVNDIVKNNELPKEILKLIDIKLKKTEFYTPENLDRIKNCTLVALKNDFWMDGYELHKPEHEFTVEKEYKIGGFIDVLGVKKLENGKLKIKIRDYKNQRNLFTPKELQFNVQGYTYLLSAREKFPEMDLLESEIEFVMLQHPDNLLQVFKLSSIEQLDGYEEYLKYVQISMDEFTEEKAQSNLAAEKGFPTENEGFCKKLLCGFAKNPGQLKKDGTKMWYCPQKFAFEYYVLVDKDNKVRYSSFVESGLPNKPDLKKEMRKYDGCPAHNTKNKITFYKK